MTTLTEPVYATESFISEAAGSRSREAITVKSGANLVSCAVIAAILSGTSASAAKSGGNTGNGTFVLDATTPILARAREGVYTLRCIAAATNGGTFRLEGPSGNVLGEFTISGGAGGTVTVNEQIKGVLTDGGTDFAVGDGFDITVSALTAKYVALAPAGTDGSQIAAGILYAAVDASASDKPGVAWVADCEHNAAIVQWPAGITTAQKAIAKAQLAERGILLR